MALTIKHLNDDASFFLTFEPLVPHNYRGPPPSPFYILLDPWITGPSTTFHPKLSVAVRRRKACISSALELPEPDLVIISQDKTDHLNEATLRQLPRTGTKTVILAEPASARIIRSWKHFDKDKVITIPKWEDPRITGRQTVVRIPVPPILSGGPGDPGEVTVAFIPQKRDISGLHSAIGITYRPPTVPPPSIYYHPVPGGIITPPATPKSHGSHPHLRVTFASPSPGGPTSPPTSPTSLRSVRSAATLSSHRSIQSQTPTPERPLSVLFSPHGIAYAAIQIYVTSHLIAEAALPLTALLHCFDAVSNPWWLGGNILLGAPAGAETAGKLAARAWISAHDGEKDVRGVFTSLLRTTRFGREDVVRRLGAGNSSSRSKGGQERTEVLCLGIGEETVLTGEGVCVPLAPCVPERRDGESWLDLDGGDEEQGEGDVSRGDEGGPGGFANLGEVLGRC